MPRHREPVPKPHEREECRICGAVPKDMTRHLLMTHAYNADQILAYERGKTNG